MMSMEKSILKDFLRLVGFISVEKPQKKEFFYTRVGYPWPFLKLPSFEKYLQMVQAHKTANNP